MIEINLTSNNSSHFYEDYEEIEDELTVRIAVILTCLFFALILTTVLEEWKKVQEFLPASAMYIIIGLIASGFFIAGGYTPLEVRQRYGLDPPTFFLVLLPPIIFDGAFSMKQLYFWRNIVRIGLLAVVGTLISTLVVFFPTYFLSGILWPSMRFGTALAFAGLISATDPVAALAVYGSVGVSERLFSTVFGEATLNDAVAIVIYSVATELIKHDFR